MFSTILMYFFKCFFHYKNPQLRLYLCFLQKNLDFEKSLVVVVLFLLLRQKNAEEQQQFYFRSSIPFFKNDPSLPTNSFESLALGKKSEPYSESDQEDLCGRFSLRPNGYVRVDSETDAEKRLSCPPPHPNSKVSSCSRYLVSETLVRCLFHLKQANSRQDPQNISI